MEKVTVEISYTGNNYCAYVPSLLGCVSTGRTLSDLKKNIGEAISLHVRGSIADNDPIDDVFKGEYELTYKLTPEALLNSYSDVFTKAALSRITGINERQLWHYAAGKRHPRPAQRQKISIGLHKLAHDLLAVEV
jgi:predicted RNase H-like HicB family nuclease